MFSTELTLQFLKELSNYYKTKDIKEICQLAEIILIKREMHPSIQLVFQLVDDVKFLYINNSCNINSLLA